MSVCLRACMCVCVCVCVYVYFVPVCERECVHESEGVGVTHMSESDAHMCLNPLSILKNNPVRAK